MGDVTMRLAKYPHACNRASKQVAHENTSHNYKLDFMVRARAAYWGLVASKP
jgi:hypothetical protein